MRSSLGVEVGAEREDDNTLSTRDGRCVEKVVEKAGSLLLVAAERERLLRLVDNEHDTVRGWSVDQCQHDGEVESALIGDESVDGPLHGAIRTEPEQLCRKGAQWMSAGGQRTNRPPLAVGY